MDGGSDLNLLYLDTIRKMGIDPTKVRHSNTSFQGVMPGPYAHCTGSLLLEVVFGSPDNFCRKKLTFHLAPFTSSYQALLGHEAFARFNSIPHYASLTLKNAQSTRRHLLKRKYRVFLERKRLCDCLDSHTLKQLH